MILKTEFSRVHHILSQATAITSGSAAYLKWGLKIAQRDKGLWGKQFVLGAETKSKGEAPIYFGVKRINILKTLI